MYKRFSNNSLEKKKKKKIFWFKFADSLDLRRHDTPGESNGKQSQPISRTTYHNMVMPALSSPCLIPKWLRWCHQTSLWKSILYGAKNPLVGWCIQRSHWCNLFPDITSLPSLYLFNFNAELINSGTTNRYFYVVCLNYATQHTMPMAMRDKILSGIYVTRFCRLHWKRRCLNNRTLMRICGSPYRDLSQ